MDPNTLSNHQFQVTAGKAGIRRYVERARDARQSGNTAQFEHNIRRAGNERRIVTAISMNMHNKTK